jgi:protoheme IX farnesyltransferase
MAADYFEMTKPKVQSLLLFTTVTTMYVAGDPSLGLVALTCIGGALSAGGAGAINHVLDRDIDRTMSAHGEPARSPRGASRPPPGLASASRWVAGVRAAGDDRQPARGALSLSGLLGYVFVYTLWLKRSTPQNIVIGGAAGAVPPLVAWAAVTGG